MAMDLTDCATCPTAVPRARLGGCLAEWLGPERARFEHEPFECLAPCPDVEMVFCERPPSGVACESGVCRLRY